MPTLQDLLATPNGSPVLVTQPSSVPQVVEPLDGPTPVDALMDRFPETVYAQGRDSHLYRFLTALCGDAGAGLLKKQSYAARLASEAQYLAYDALDGFYATQYGFRRLASETYTQGTQTQALTPETWSQIDASDSSYQSRAIDFMNATRLGNTPAGMALAARAASGIDTEIFEQYRYIYDLYSDDPLGIAPQGRTLSLSEFVVRPHTLNASGIDVNNVTFQRKAWQLPTFVSPVVTNTRPATLTTPPSVSYAWQTTQSLALLPSVERNVIDILDRLGSVPTFANIQPDQILYLTVAVNGTPTASSSRIALSRFVTGDGGVFWPSTDTTVNQFIQANVENESGYFADTIVFLPVIFDSIENVDAYTNYALADPTYLLSTFEANTNGVSPLNGYISEFFGQFSPLFASIFPFLQSQSNTGSYTADQALAIHTTPLVLRGSNT